MKKKPEEVEFSEEAIETAIKYLKTNTTKYPSRENAINHLRIMQGTAHIIAHGVVKKEREEKPKKTR